MAENYGVDVSTYPDFDPTGRSLSGRRVLAEHLARLIETQEGLLEYDPEQRTIDIIEYLSLDMDDDDVRQLEIDISAIWSSDERVASADVTVTLEGEGLSIEGKIQPTSGKPFALVLSATDAGVLLSQVT